MKKFTYLGIVFSSGGSFSETFKTLSGQSLKAIYKLQSYLYKFTDISVVHKLELFDKLILPILNYGSEVWGYNKADCVEKVHLSFCKNILGVRKTTQNSFIYGELGRTPLIYKRYVNIIKYWFKILYCNDMKYIKVMYNVMLNDLVKYPNKKSWAYQVRNILQMYGFNEAWLFQSIGDINVFIKVFKQRVKDNYMQTWTGELELSSRASLYRLFGLK